MKRNILNNIPPEYDGTKLGSTRTVRDILQTRDEIERYVNHEKAEAVVKERKKNEEASRRAFRVVVALIVLAPPIAYLEYLLLRWIGIF